MQNVPQRDATPDDREPRAEQRTDRRDAVRRPEIAAEERELAIDEAIEMTFPASDPPAWGPT